MSPLAEAIRAQAFVLADSRSLQPLLERVGDIPLVVLGTAIHGSRELYHQRIAITQQLITDKQINVVGLEADWPAVQRVNQFILHQGQDSTPTAALADFAHFPSWLWRNQEFAAFIGWLREHNQTLRPPQPPVELIGLDLYERQAAMATVLQVFCHFDAEAAQWARTRFASFDHAVEVPHPYEPVLLEIERGQVNQIVTYLLEQQHARREQATRSAVPSVLEQFHAEQSRRIVRSAELYYRSLFEERTSSANLHQEHMLGTISALFEFHRQRQHPLKMAVWSHNVHAGDSRATQLGAAGEWNIGELVRELYGDKVMLIGLTSYDGALSATTDWDGPVQQLSLRPALLGSYEALFHESGHPRLLLCFGPDDDLTDALYQPRLERAIGAVYLLGTERLSHYYQARLSSQFNAVLHIDRTAALEPLEHTSQWDRGTTAEPYPHAA